MLVEGPDKKQFRVATNRQANLAFAQITVSRLRAAWTAKMDKIEQDGAGNIEVEVLRKMTATADLIENMGFAAYDEGRSPKDKDTSAFERQAFGAIRAAAAGVADSLVAKKESSFEEKLAKMRKITAKVTAPKKVVQLPTEDVMEVE